MDDPQGFLNVETPKPAEVVDILATPEAAPMPEVQTSAPMEMPPAVEMAPVEVAPPVETPVAAPVEAAPAKVEAEPRNEKFESIMGALRRESEGKDEAVEAVPAEQRAAFEAKHHAVASAIYEMATKGEVNPNDVRLAISGWLHEIPGVTSDYLEQEVYLRTVQVMRSLSL